MDGRDGINAVYEDEHACAEDHDGSRPSALVDHAAEDGREEQGTEGRQAGESARDVFRDAVFGHHQFGGKLLEGEHAGIEEHTEQGDEPEAWIADHGYDILERELLVVARRGVDEYLAVQLAVHEGEAEERDEASEQQDGTDEERGVQLPCLGHGDGHGVGRLHGGVIRPGIVHRIDKNTSGLLVVAKNDAAHLSLSKQIAEKSCRRTYLALLEGNLKDDRGVISTYIGRNPNDRVKMAVVDAAHGKYAVTEYEVIGRSLGYTFCRFVLQTGRTHQIRVHAKHIGHPIVGDDVYGRKKREFGLNGQLLHACRLELTHPSTGERMTFEAPLPDYFVAVLKKLKFDGFC